MIQLSRSATIAFGFFMVSLIQLPNRVAAQHSQSTTHRSPSKSTVLPQDSALLSQALSDYDAGRLAFALPVLLKLAERYPVEPNLQAATGMCLLESGRLEEGVNHLETAHQLLPRNTELSHNLGIAYLKLHRTQKALPLLQLTVSQVPQSVEARLALAQAQREAGKLDFAAASFGQAATLQTPPSPELLYDWAGTLLAMGQAEKALEVIQRIPAQTADATLEELKGEIQEKAGKPTEAIASFRRAAELNPTALNVQAYGEELLRHWTFGSAAIIFQYGVNRYPDNTRLSMDLGIAYFGQNDFARSSEVFNSLLAKDPENGMLADLLGRSCSATLATETRSCDGLATFALKHPNNASAALYAGISFLQRAEDPESTKQSEVLLRQAVHADAKLPEAWYQLGVLQQRQGDWAGSEDSLRHAIALKPSYPEAHYRLSRAYSRTGRAAEARTEMAFHNESADEEKREEKKRMEGVLTFLTTPN